MTLAAPPRLKIARDTDTAAGSAVCGYEGCTALVALLPGPGRPRKFCAEHAVTRKREQDRAREKSRDSGGITPPACCADYRRARGRGRVCPQHQQWRKFRSYELRKAGWLKAHLEDEVTQFLLNDPEAITIMR